MSSNPMLICYTESYGGSSDPTEVSDVGRGIITIGMAVNPSLLRLGRAFY